MEFEQLIKRINELSRKSKAEGLTPEEKAGLEFMTEEYAYVRSLIVSE